VSGKKWKSGFEKNTLTKSPETTLPDNRLATKPLIDKRATNRHSGRARALPTKDREAFDILCSLEGV